MKVDNIENRRMNIHSITEFIKKVLHQLKKKVQTIDIIISKTQML
jgi:hypothetical protein